MVSKMSRGMLWHRAWLFPWVAFGVLT
jgi:hypothetical protein